MKALDYPASFWAKTDKSGGADACWPWMGTRLPAGYGQHGRHGYAHRIAHELELGPIPAGYQVDHLCSNPPCVNPAHLEAVTPRENVLRSNAPTARHARQTHCEHGHPFDEANTYRPPSGRRMCRSCADARRAGLSYRLEHSQPVLRAWPPRTGDVVVIRKGATLTGSHPRTTAGRNYLITVKDFDGASGAVLWSSSGWSLQTADWCWPPAADWEREL